MKELVNIKPCSVCENEKGYLIENNIELAECSVCQHLCDSNEIKYEPIEH